MFTIFVIVIVVLVVLLQKSNEKNDFQNKKIHDLESQIEVLKNQINKIENEKEPKDNISISDNLNKEVLKNSEFVQKEKQDIQNVKVNIKEDDLKNEALNSIDKKNNNILLTGSILIVLSAIVFLTSTWHTIPNIVKTLGLIIFIIIFLGASKIAKDKFKLEKTSKTFFYIAMAYIPICLIGISYFGLIGEFFSIRGEGRGIYLALVSTFLAILYYLLSKSKYSKGLLISSVIAQCSAIVAFTSIIETRFNLICAIFLLYNIVIILLTKDNLFKFVSKLILYTISGIFVIYICFLNIFYSYDILDILVVLLLVFDYFAIYRKYKLRLDFILFNIFTIFLGNLFISYKAFEITTEFKDFLKLLWILTTYFFVNVLTEDKNKLGINTIISMFAILVCGNYSEKAFFKIYIYAIIESIILTITYCRNIFNKENMQILLPIAYLITATIFIVEYNLGDYALVILTIISCVISFLIKDNKFQYNVFLVSHIGIICSVLNMIFNYDSELLGILLLVLVEVIYIVSYYKRNKMYIYKYCGYITLILILRMINLHFVLELDYYILPISSIIIFALEHVHSDNVNDKYLEYFMMFIFSLSYFSLILDIQIYNVILAIILSIILFCADYFENKNSSYNIIGLIGLFLVIVLFDNSYISLMVGIILSILSILNISKKYEFTVGSLLFLLDFGIDFDNRLIAYSILFLWSVLHMIIKKDNKNIFKIITYISGYLTYVEILNFLDLDIYVFSKLLGIEIFGYLLFNTCFKKDDENLNLIKYISYGLVYIWAIVSYYNIIDGMISVAIMIAIVIISYLGKDSSIVLINLVAIIINSFGLTREFWLSIPWWIYLLVVGFVLIGFAIINEAREKDNKIKLSSVIKSIKDKIEKND